MSKFGEWLGEKRPEVLFLPVVVYGYIYVEHDNLGPCTILISRGFSSTAFLVLAALTAVAAAILYTALIYTDFDALPAELSPEEPWQQVEETGMYKWTMILVMVVYAGLFLGSVVELVLRWCREDMVLISIGLFYLTLIVMLITESQIPDSQLGQKD